MMTKQKNIQISSNKKEHQHNAILTFLYSSGEEEQDFSDHIYLSICSNMATFQSRWCRKTIYLLS